MNKPPLFLKYRKKVFGGRVKMAGEPFDMIWFFEFMGKKKFKSWEEEDRYAREHNIHIVCLRCRRKCKQPYSFWSDQMPPDVFCEEFEEGS